MQGAIHPPFSLQHIFEKGLNFSTDNEISYTKLSFTSQLINKYGVKYIARRTTESNNREPFERKTNSIKV
jgi:hypothetical protein